MSEGRMGRCWQAVISQRLSIPEQLVARPRDEAIYGGVRVATGGSKLMSTGSLSAQQMLTRAHST